MVTAAEAVRLVEDREQRARWWKQLRALTLAIPELDGCFIDSHELGRVYGTAMGLLTLATLPAEGA